MSDLRQTLAWATYLKRIGWEVERLDSSFVYLKKLPILGWIAKVQRPPETAYKEIDNLARELGVALVYVEPAKVDQADILKDLGFRLNRNPFLPTKTLKLKLVKPKEHLFNQLKKDARYAIRKTQKSKLKSQKVENIKEFRKAWQKAAGWGKYVPPLWQLKALKDSFGKNCLLSECLNTLKQPIAGAVFVIADGAAYYLYAFTSPEGRRVLAQYRVLWEGILWAKSRGARIFDFEGIYDERFPRKSWLGFTHFKKSFGGYAVEYPGCFVKSYTIAGKLISLVDT